MKNSEKIGISSAQECPQQTPPAGASCQLQQAAVHLSLLPCHARTTVVWLIPHIKPGLDTQQLPAALPRPRLCQGMFSHFTGILQDAKQEAGGEVT